ncbi:pirin family protein [Chloracidobacterium thermophilum]|uniref:pirin family protein n=1 Tax=Chloracidobacterium thermophilum TaxID=458033 RepID=UPI000738BF27|nr:pirin family protein [Chloracidobacterium thermophilum]
MITLRPNGERGNTRTYWLDSHHTFSFGRYYDPRYLGFRDLRVINEDWVRGGSGFGTHSHNDMEIITYVIEGALAHKDSTGGSGIIRPGDVQRMSAGTGISHSEYNASETETVHFLQIWILPEQQNLQPGYEQRTFTAEERQGRLRLIASRDSSEDSVTIHQDAKLFAALLAPQENVAYELSAKRYAWLQSISGSVTLNGTLLRAGDGAAIEDETRLTIQAQEPSEFLLFDLA